MGVWSAIAGNRSLSRQCEAIHADAGSDANAGA